MVDYILVSNQIFISNELCKFYWLVSDWLTILGLSMQMYVNLQITSDTVHM